MTKTIKTPKPPKVASDTPPARIGRPPINPDARLLTITIRLTAAHQQKLADIGMPRLRDWLERAKVPA